MADVGTESNMMFKRDTSDTPAVLNVIREMTIFGSTIIDL